MEFIDFKDPEFIKWAAALPPEKQRLAKELSLEELGQLSDAELQERKNLCKEFLQAQLHEAIVELRSKKKSAGALMVESPLTAEEPKDEKEDVLDWISDNCTEFFADQYEKPYAVVQVNSHRETMQIASSNFKYLVAHLYYQRNGGMLSSEDMTRVLNALKGRALFDGLRRRIETRVASKMGDDSSAIYYDLTDQEWQCVKISREGWMVEQIPVLFTRYNNNAPQVKPVRDYPPDIFDRFLGLTNIASHDHKLLLKCYLVSLFIPEISKPILITHGEQESDKSFLQRCVKSIVDPSAAEKLSFPKSPTELTQQLSHNYVAMYDNISRLDDWISDELCKAVDGSGSSKRQLYSDDDDIIYNFKRCILLNGINLAARKADLLDRSLIIQLERIPRERRKKESQLLAELEGMKPALMGYIFDVLVKVMKRIDEVQLVEYPRLADFAEYGETIARCMGYNAGEFMKAYFDNIKLQTVEVLESNPVATAIMKLMEPPDLNIMTTTPRELLEKLQEIAAGLKLDVKARTWPKAPNSLSRRLNEVKTNLREVGILVEMEVESKTNTRIVRLRKISPSSPTSPAA